MADKTKYKRLFDLHKRFLAHGRLTIQTMMEDYGINRRTANRDINDLIALGVRLENNTLENGLKVWYAPGSQRQVTVPFNLTDLAALFLGKGLFDFSQGTLLQESLDKIYETIEAQISRKKDFMRLATLKKKVHSISEGPKTLSSRHVDELDEVLTGLLEERHIQFEYTSSSQKKSTHHAIPYTLVTYKKGLYLLAKPAHKSSAPLRLFAIERMMNTESIKGTTYRLPKEFHPEAHFESALFVQTGTPKKIEVVFDSTSAPFIRMRKFHKSQKLTPLKDGRTQMTLFIPADENDFEIVNWIISFHEHIEVISPRGLRDRVASKLAAALAQYK